jgi:hypothetical protein
MLDMLNRQILPASFAYEQRLTKICLNKKALKIDNKVELYTLKILSNLIKEIDQSKTKLLKALIDVRDVNE